MFTEVPKRWRKAPFKNEKEEIFNVHLLKEESVLNLYRERLNRYLDQRPISNNIKLDWNELKGSVIQAADEVSGGCKKKYNKRDLQTWNQNTARLIR
jgi:hypothetical protein